MNKMSIKKAIVVLVTFCMSKSFARTLLPYNCDCDTKVEYNLNCEKYFECESGKLYLSDCENGLYFDENLQTCIKPNVSSCKQDPEFMADSWVNGSCHSNDNKLKSFEWDCGQFYQCGSGILALQKCKSGLYFNEQLQVCDYPSNAPCHLPCDQTTPSPPSSPTTPSTPSSSPTPTPCREGGFHEPCQAYVDKKPYSNCSSQYYMCLPENCYYPASCKPDWRFDPDWTNQDPDEMYCKDPCLVSGCENDCDQINEMNLKNQIILLKDPSEFNKPKCYQEPSGECPSIINREKCQSKFSLCYEGWICEYTCKNNQVYNFKSNNCQELYSCQKSMREDL